MIPQNGLRKTAILLLPTLNKIQFTYLKENKRAVTRGGKGEEKMNMKYLALGVIAITFLFDTWMKYLDMKSADREIPDNVKDIYDADSYQKWLHYDREKNRLNFWRHIAMYLTVFIMFGFDGYARLLSLLGIRGDYAAGMGVLVIDFLICLIYAIPYEYVDSMVIEQKYGFNRMTKKTFVIDQIKDIVINLVITCGICALFIAIHKALGNWLLVVFTAVMFVIILAIMFLSPVLGKIYNKFEPLPDGELRDRLTKLLAENGCTVREIKVMDGSKRSAKANAYFTGFGKSKTIVLYDTLLEQMTDDEIVAVFAHEMGHNKHKDTMKMYAMNLINIVIFVLIAWMLVTRKEIYAFFGFEGVNYGFAFVLLSTVCMSFLSPFLGLFTSALMRKFEYAADRFAAENGYGKELIAALKVLTRNTLSCLTPHPIVVKLTYSHPTVSQRIAAIEKVHTAGLQSEENN